VIRDFKVEAELNLESSENLDGFKGTSAKQPTGGQPSLNQSVSGKFTHNNSEEKEGTNLQISVNNLTQTSTKSKRRKHDKVDKGPEGGGRNTLSPDMGKKIKLSPFNRLNFETNKFDLSENSSNDGDGVNLT